MTHGRQVVEAAHVEEATYIFQGGDICDPVAQVCKVVAARARPFVSNARNRYWSPVTPARVIVTWKACLEKWRFF